jgi:MFS transporter, FHS family, Na+ dependent glucose transporter 1
LTSVTEGVATHQEGGARQLAVTFAYYAAFVALGLVAASLGPTLPALAQQTHTALGEISFLFATRSSGYLLGSLLAGRLYDRVRGHPLMALCLLLMGACTALVPAFSFLWGLAILLLLLGVAEGIVDVGGNALIVWIHGSRVGPYMNALHFFFGLGAFLSPIVVAQAMVATGGVAWAYWLLACCSLPVAIWILRLKSPRHEAAHVGGERQHVPVNWRLTGLVMLFLCVYVGVEVGVGGWLYSYAVEMGLADTTNAAYLTSVYWGAFMLARLVSIPIAARLRPRVILASDLLGCMVSVGLLVVLPESRWAVWVGTFGVGFFVASIFPTVITWSERRMSMSGQVTSMFLVGSSLGGIFFPWFIGQLFDVYGPWITMPAILVVLVALFGIFLLLMAVGGAPKIETHTPEMQAIEADL